MRALDVQSQRVMVCAATLLTSRYNARSRVPLDSGHRSFGLNPNWVDITPAVSHAQTA